MSAPPVSRSPLVTSYFVVGGSFVVLGGLVAAVTEPLHLTDGSWLAAYLVLVCGVAQGAFGKAEELLSTRPVPVRSGLTQLACWNLGNASVIAGTLATAPVAVDLGGALLLVPLVLAFRAVRSSSRRLLGWVYRGILVILGVSIPVGLTLAHLQAA